MSSLPRILLLTGSPPGDRGVGQIIVNEICQNYPHDKIFCFAALSRHDNYEKPAEFGDLTVETVHRRYEHQFRPMGRLLSPITTRASYWGMYRRHCRTLTRQAIEFGRQHRCDLLFSILENTTVMQMTDPVAKGLAIPKHLLVWDAPDYIANMPGQMPLSVEAMVDTFSQAMQGAKQLAVVSEPMARKYKSDFGLESTILRHVAAPPANSPQSLSDNDAGKPFVIGFAGSVTAKPQLELLQQALDRLDWQIDGREIRLDLYGLRFVLQARTARNVRYCGYRSVQDTVESLSQTADLLFMPQPFDKPSASFTELSFPTKISTYFAVGRPILLLSPQKSSLGEFFTSHPFGVWCREMQADRLLESLREIMTNPELQTSSVQTIQQLLKQSFNKGHFGKQLHRFLAVDSVQQDALD